MNLILKLKETSRINYINYLILLYAFSLTLPQGIKRFAAVFLILLWIFDKSKTINFSEITSIFFTFNLFIFFTLISYFWSDSTIQEVLQYTKKYWHYLPLFIIYKYIKKDYIPLSITFFLSGVFVSEILSYGNFFGIWQIGYGTMTDPTVFYNHTQYSIFLSITSIFLLFAVFNEKKKLIKFFLILFFLSVTINLLINGGRTGQIAFFITIILSSLYYFKFNFKIFIFSIASSIIVFILAYNYSSVFKLRINSINTDIEKMMVNNYTSSIGGRIGFYVILKDAFLENPILGAGTASHLKISKKIIKNNYPQLIYTSRLMHSHNQYIEIVLQLGLIGLFLFLFFLYKLIKLDINNNNLKMLLFITLSIFILGSIPEILFYLHGTISLFAFVVGISLAQYKYEKIELPND